MEGEETNDDKNDDKTGEVKVKDLVPFFGVCCFIVSLYVEIPDCFGAVCENSICCLNAKTLLCKSSKEPGTICKCCSADIDIKQFSSCCMVKYFIKIQVVVFAINSDFFSRERSSSASS